MRTPVPNFPLIQCFAVLVLAFVLAPSIAAQSQITTATIQGTVKDVNGAVVSGAEVEIKNIATGSTRTVTTNEDGVFKVLQLQPGDYSIRISRQGFATTVVEKATLTVGQTLTLDNIEMKVGGVAGEVTVTER